MGLREYKAKRDFKQTDEPAGGEKVAPRSKKDPFFVIQKHAATRLHYDFRLEMEGVLKSWAIPKGLPTEKGDRRLAVHVEDHPLEYGNFEGTIPAGNYGAGTVMVWDHGSYRVSGDNPVEALHSGKLHLTLHGKKLKGDWTLVRMRPRQEGDKEQWLIFKSGEDLPPISARAEDQSVLTKRSLEEIAEARDAEWESNRKTSRKESRRSDWDVPETNSRRSTSLTSQSAALSSPRSDNGRHRSNTRVRAKKKDRTSVPATAPELDGSDGKLLRSLSKGTARFVEPMKCLLVDRLPRGDDWTYEVKFDGFRALTVKQKTKVSLISRNAKDLTLRFPEIAEALQNLPCREATLDGEIVAVDPQGRSSFQMLQSYNTPGADKPPIFYYAFDLLHLDGRDLISLPLVQRKELLAKLVEPLPQRVLFSASLEAAPEHLLREMKARGLEGLIAKRKQSKYEIGQRNGSWVKFKWTNEQEFVIGGYTPPEGARTHFGALLVGYYENGQLLFASKVGTGFNYTLLKELHEQFQKLITSTCPFANLPEKIKGRYGQGMTAAEMKHCTWIKPMMVCQIRFTEWTRDNHLRHPAFLGLREDKKATEVVREKLE